MQVEPASNNLDNQDNPKRKIVLGVCAFLSDEMNMPVFFLRLIFFLLALWGGLGLFVYIISFFRFRKNISNSLYEMNTEYFWGIILISTGTFLFFRETFIFNYLNYFRIPIQIIDSFLLIFAGLVFLEVKEEIFSRDERKKFSLSKEERKLLGVCGGFAGYLNINPNAIRMLWMIFSFATAGFGVVAYLAIYFSKNVVGEDE